MRPAVTEPAVSWKRTLRRANRIVLLVLAPLAVLFVAMAYLLDRTLTPSSTAILVLGVIGIGQELMPRAGALRHWLTIVSSTGFSTLIVSGLIAEVTSVLLLAFGVLFVVFMFVVPAILETESLVRKRQQRSSQRG